ncbi:MAG: DUF456 domain-containing protein [Caldilineaceae bacterium]|nr:DUF456 domain-containing protein [Caldilineaceae bacterium]MCB9162158.1 DUF456 domain-containing protein [Caldilineaceae bacterium]
MFASELNLLGVAGSALVVLGFIGTVLPIVPGPIIIWLGAFVWAWGDGFQRIGWPTLAVLGLLAVLAWGMDFFLTAVVSRRAGASWRAIGGAIVGGLLGGMLLSGTPPILGSIIGALLGAVAGMWFIEYRRKRDRRAAWVAVRAYIGSMAASFVLELGLALVMVAIFIWQATGWPG